MGSVALVLSLNLAKQTLVHNSHYFSACAVRDEDILLSVILKYSGIPLKENLKLTLHPGLIRYTPDANSVF